MEKVGSERDELRRTGWESNELGRLGSGRDELRRVGSERNELGRIGLERNELRRIGRKTGFEKGEIRKRWIAKDWMGKWRWLGWKVMRREGLDGKDINWEKLMGKRQFKGFWLERDDL